MLLGKTSIHIVKPYKWLAAARKISVLGVSAGFSQIAMAVVSFVINNQIMKYSGASALAVYGFLGTVSALFLSVFSGIGQATQPIVSENYGAGQRKRYTEVGKTGLITAVIFGIVSFGICALFPSQMVSVFMKPTPEVEQIAPYIIRVCALSYFPLAINMFVMAYLQSVTKANGATLISVLRGMILPLILIFVMPTVMNGNGIWWSITAAEGIAAVLAAVFIISELKTQKATA
jgi:Na+-driven multidrug efflux pump